MTAMVNAMRVHRPVRDRCHLHRTFQDVEGESYDFPDYLFEKRVHRITRPCAVKEEIEDLVNIIKKAKESVSDRRRRREVF